MHLGNGIICPVTGIPMLVAAGAAAFLAYKKGRKEVTKDKIVPAVALTALVFSLQMLNFTIPSTGSSGHIVGGILLAALLGPYAAFLAMCAILIVQAVFFADGGLLALGCNIFNMGLLACFVAYPLLYKPLAERSKTFFGAVLASIAALQLGAIAAVAEAYLSGSITGNILNFAGLMQAIHLPIGIVEGVVSGCVILFARRVGKKTSTIVFGAISLLCAGVIAQYASSKPDGLEWSLLNISDSVVMQTQYALYTISEALQAKSALLLSLPAYAGNLLGVVAVGGLMYLSSLALSAKTVKADAE